MKNLFIIKKITENKELSDQAFVVWCVYVCHRRTYDKVYEEIY